ncbi:MAG: G5 domain-containing protein [Oscillospiraceae bacterium]|nr:G5 domain-containing protein [Oscillospiraceae bacterium]
MANWFRTKLNQIFHGGSGEEEHVLQPDILEVAPELVEPIREETDRVEPVPADPTEEPEISGQEEVIPEEADAEEMPADFAEEAPEAQEEIEETVPEYEALPVSEEEASPKEAAAKVSVEELTARMESMPFFTGVPEPGAAVPEAEAPASVAEEMAEVPAEAVSGTAEEEIPVGTYALADFEDSAEPELLAQEDAVTEETVTVDTEEYQTETTESPEQESEEDTAEAPEENIAGEPEEEQPETAEPENAEETSEAPDETGTADTEADLTETPEIPDQEDEQETGEDTDETAAAETKEEQPETPDDAGQETAGSEETVEDGAEKADSSMAEELSDLWRLNLSEEEILKEKKRERKRKAVAWILSLLILASAAGGGYYAYEQGWRINLFYEVRQSQDEAEEVSDGRKRRPDSSEFEDDTEEETPQDAQTATAPEGSDTPEKEDTAESGEKDKEFVGVTISKEEDPEKISQEGPTGQLETPDQVTVGETGPVQTVEVERAVNFYLSVDGAVREIRALPAEVKTVAQLLNKAGVTLSSDDIVEPSKDSTIAEGDTVKVTRIVYKEYTQTEVIQGQAIERLTPILRAGRTYAINQGGQADGEMEVTYRDKYVNGQLESHEVINSVVTKEATDYILLVGANIAASPINGAQYTDTQIIDGVPATYSAVYSGRCTAYNFRSGAYGASGMYLSQGMVAVDPSVIPYGSLLYITNSDGSFVYSWAIAADYCEASAAGIAVVDLFFDTYRECVLFGARSLNVYVVEQLTQGDLAGYIAKEGMFRSRVPA